MTPHLNNHPHYSMNQVIHGGKKAFTNTFAGEETALKMQPNSLLFTEQQLKKKGCLCQ